MKYSFTYKGKNNNFSYFNGLIEKWNIDISTDTIIRKFRWSSNLTPNEKSEWQDYSIDLINTLQIYCKEGFEIEFLFENVDNENAVLESVKLNFVCKDQTKESIPIEIIQKNFPLTFNPLCNTLKEIDKIKPFNFLESNMKMISIQKSLSYYTFLSQGFDCLYFKLNPEINTRDPFLLEYGLLNYECGKPFKILFEDGELPEENLNFTAFGLDYEPITECYIDLTYWQSVFGEGTMPNENDIIYFKFMDRLYEVQSSMIERKFLFQPTNYKISLVKYQKRANVIPSENDLISDIELLNDNILTMENIFGDEIKDEYKQITNKQQFKTKTTQENYGRKLHFESNVYVSERNIKPNLSLDFVDTDEIYLNNILLSKNQYNFHKLLQHDNTFKNQLAVSYYPDRESLEETDNYVFLFWYKFPENTNPQKEYKIKSYKRTEINETTEKLELHLENTISIQKLNEKQEILININDEKIIGVYENYNRTKKILNVIVNKTELKSTQLINEDTNIDGYFSIIEIRELINTNNEMFKIQFIDEKTLRVYINDKILYYEIKPILDKWTLLTVKVLFSLGNNITVKQYDTNENEIVINETKQIEDEIECSYIDYLQNIKEFQLHYTDIQLCNITCYNKNIPDEKLIEVAQQYIITDPQNVIFVDRMQEEKQNNYMGITR